MKSKYVYKTYLAFPIRVAGALIVAFSIIVSIKNECTFFSFLVIVFGLIMLLLKNGFVINSNNKNVTKIFSIGLIVPYIKQNLSDRIISVKVKKISYDIKYKPNPLTNITPNLIKKKGYYVAFVLKNNEFYFLKYYYNIDDAISLANKISKALEISFNPEKIPN